VNIDLSFLDQLSLGRISLTSDLWSDPNMASYAGITAHYCAIVNGRLVIKTRLLAFRLVSSDHSGKELAHLMFKILEDADILHKVRQFYTFRNTRK
jgi:hypothetical protein